MKKNYVKPEMTEVVPDFPAILQPTATSSEHGPGYNGEEGGDEGDAKQRGIWGTDKNNLLW